MNCSTFFKFRIGRIKRQFLFMLAIVMIMFVYFTEKSQLWLHSRLELRFNRPCLYNGPVLRKPGFVSLAQLSQGDRSLDPSRRSPLDCVPFERRFDRIFDVSAVKARLVVGARMASLYASWLGDSNISAVDVNVQRVVAVRNKWTGEEIAWNGLRSRRPGAAVDEDAAAADLKELKALIASKRRGCGFCRPTIATAGNHFVSEPGGRLNLSLAWTSANAFAAAKFHGLSIAKRHSFLELDVEDFLAMSQAAHAWFGRLSDDVSRLRRVVTFDAAPSGGASQIHPHLQMFAFEGAWPRGWRRTFDAAREYRRVEGKDYFEDLIELHRTMGLETLVAEVSVMAHICPVKDAEILVLSRAADAAFFRAIFGVVSMWRSRFRFAFSMGMALPVPTLPIDDDDADNWAVARIVPRPNSGSLADFSAHDLYLKSVVSSDPLEIQEAVADHFK